MHDIDHSFGKSFKLCSQAEIDLIFKNGITIKEYPFIAKINPEFQSKKEVFQIVISAPKRTFRHAHDRNRIKRLCKEAIRLNKEALQNYLVHSNKSVSIFLIYSAKEEISLEVLSKKITRLFKKLTETI